MAAENPSSRRLVSLDQFRGYTVAGMFLVNFVGGFEAVKLVTPVLCHHHDYCSYADTIMPQFLFAVGFAFRMTVGRRIQSHGLGSVAFRVIRRLLGLALVAVCVYTDGRKLDDWTKLEWDAGPKAAAVESAKPPESKARPGRRGSARAADDKIYVKQVLLECMKRDWYQTLMHIAVTSLWILPVIGLSANVRMIYMFASAVAHVWLSYKFNFLWVNTAPNGIDGGPLGFLTWCVPALVGSIVCDFVMANPKSPPIAGLLGWSILLMGAAYAISCPTTLYNVEATDIAIKPQYASKLAHDPVIPDQTRMQGRKWGSLLAEPPFVPPPHDPEWKPEPQMRTSGSDADSSAGAGKPAPPKVYRQWNYWMMTQRAGSISYTLFGAGFSIAVYVLFWFLGDKLGIEIPMLRSLGVNALAGYVLFGPLGAAATEAFIPRNAPLWYVFAGFAVFFVWIWIVLRSLEKNKIFIRV